MNFQFNWKCVIQGFFVCLLFYAAYYHWTAEPGILSMIFLFWFTYVMNAFLDVIFGCDHGDIYKTILGKS